jgi:hypothetical protein
MEKTTDKKGETMKSILYKYGFATLLVFMIAGCAPYSTNSDISFESTVIDAPKTVVIITRGTIGHIKYEEIGEIEAKVKKSKPYHPNPTEEQVNVVLSEKAKRLGADAVINVTYESKRGYTSWGVITARGIAVRFVE